MGVAGIFCPKRGMSEMAHAVFPIMWLTWVAGGFLVMHLAILKDRIPFAVVPAWIGGGVVAMFLMGFFYG